MIGLKGRINSRYVRRGQEFLGMKQDDDVKERREMSGEIVLTRQ